MLIVGTADGAYAVTGLPDSAELRVRKVLDTPRVERVRTFDGVEGVFAAAETGLYHSRDGSEWTDLGVPVETVWAVTVAPDGETIYAGTRPTHVYAAPLPEPGQVPAAALDWEELAGFQTLPGRENWGVPRHGDMAQVRDLCIHPASPERIVAGVEPAGVHVSTDGGETWEARREGVHEDIHGLHVVDDGEYVAATGRGLYRTTDAARTWRRLDTADQRYFRAAHEYDDVLYASAACVPPAEFWETPEADPALFWSADGETLERISAPHDDEVIVGWATSSVGLLGVTHRGTILRRSDGEWSVAGDLPTEESIAGCYYSLAEIHTPA
jgi:hypothetical protein